MTLYSLWECCRKTRINFYSNFYMYVAHNAFYLACILRGCDMSTVFFIRIYEIWVQIRHLIWFDDSGCLVLVLYMWLVVLRTGCLWLRSVFTVQLCLCSWFSFVNKWILYTTCNYHFPIVWECRSLHGVHKATFWCQKWDYLDWSV